MNHKKQIKALLSDPMIQEVAQELKRKYKCHTMIVYGSRARGDATAESDYDIMGVRKTGRKLWLAEKRSGYYLDVFVFPEAQMKDAGERFRYMKEGIIIFESGKFGTRFLKRLQAIINAKAKALPADEIKARKAWAFKMLDRAARGDIEGDFRRTWLQFNLLEDYFAFRKKRYEGSKAAFQYLQKNDPQTLRMFRAVFADPTSIRKLKSLVCRVTGKQA